MALLVIDFHLLIDSQQNRQRIMSSDSHIMHIQRMTASYIHADLLTDLASKIISLVGVLDININQLRHGFNARRPTDASGGPSCL